MAKTTSKWLAIISGVILIYAFIVAVAAACFSVEASNEKLSLGAEKVAYSAEMNRCTKAGQTNNDVLDAADLTDCGAKLAAETSLEVRPLWDIYKICSDSFGTNVYGCTFSGASKIYVCAPETTVYDEKITAVTASQIYYQAHSYSCDHASTTIRHELLHVVYNQLSDAEKAAALQALSEYRSEYAARLAIYDADEQDEELFVRVGADGRSVSNIELINLYARVNQAYASPKQAYYQSQLSATEASISELNTRLAICNTIAATYVGLVLAASITLGTALDRYLKTLRQATSSAKPLASALSPNK